MIGFKDFFYIYKWAQPNTNYGPQSDNTSWTRPNRIAVQSSWHTFHNVAQAWAKDGSSGWG